MTCEAGGLFRYLPSPAAIITISATTASAAHMMSTVFAILRWLDPAADPHILIY